MPYGQPLSFFSVPHLPITPHSLCLPESSFSCKSSWLYINLFQRLVRCHALLLSNVPSIRTAPPPSCASHVSSYCQSLSRSLSTGFQDSGECFRPHDSFVDIQTFASSSSILSEIKADKNISLPATFRIPGALRKHPASG